MKSIAMLIAVFVFTLAGCSDSNEVTLHKPGVYKGATDPLIEKQRSPQQQEKLIARFNQVQTDR
jgi:lipoprotein NlpI